MSDTGAGLLSRIVFAALVLASLGAFFVTQRLKHTPTAVQHFMMTPYFQPGHGSHHPLERVSFRIKESDEVTVTIIDGAGDGVATLVHDLPLRRYTQLSLHWDGRRRPHRGRVAPRGEYRVRVSLRRQHRSVLSPRSFTLR